MLASEFKNTNFSYWRRRIHRFSLDRGACVEGANVTALCQYNSFGGIGWLGSLNASVLENITVISGDIRDSGFVSDIVKNQDVVFHLAALIGIPYSYIAPRSYAEVNITGTINVLEGCRKNKNVQLIHTSTSEVYGTAITTPITETHPLQAQSPYSASKMAADHMVMAYYNTFEVNAKILRPFNTFGPRQSERAVIPTIIRQILDNSCKVIKLGSLSPVRDFNYVSNTVDAFLELATSNDATQGEVYNTGSVIGVTIGQVVNMLMDICGIAKPVEIDNHRKRPAKSEVLELIADSQNY